MNDAIEELDDFPNSITECESLRDEWKESIATINAQLLCEKEGSYAPPTADWRYRAMRARIALIRDLKDLNRHIETLRPPRKAKGQGAGEQIAKEAAHIKAACAKKVANSQRELAAEQARCKVAIAALRAALPETDLHRVFDAMNEAQANTRATWVQP